MESAGYAEVSRNASEHVEAEKPLFLERREQTEKGTKFCTAVRYSWSADCCLLNGGYFKRRDDYPENHVFSKEDLEEEFPNPTSLVVVPLPGRVIAESVDFARRLALKAARENNGGPNDGPTGAFLQHDDKMKVHEYFDAEECEENKHYKVTKIAGEPIDPERKYGTALSYKVAFDGLDKIEPLLKYIKSQPDLCKDMMDKQKRPAKDILLNDSVHVVVTGIGGGIILDDQFPASLTSVKDLKQLVLQKLSCKSPETVLRLDDVKLVEGESPCHDRWLLGSYGTGSDNKLELTAVVSQAALTVDTSQKHHEQTSAEERERAAKQGAMKAEQPDTKYDSSQQDAQQEKDAQVQYKGDDAVIKKQVRQIVEETKPNFLNITINRLEELHIRGKDIKMMELVVKALFEMITEDDLDLQDDMSRKARKGELYADMLYGLKEVAPEFDVKGDEKRMTFTRILLNVTQDSFEEQCKKHAEEEQKDKPTEASSSADGTAFDPTIALVSFIGHLYARKLVAARVLAQVVHDLIGVRDRFPMAPLILSVCELLHVVGATLDAQKQGNQLMTQFIARLNNLAAQRCSEEEQKNELMYSQEVREAIKKVSEARDASIPWPPRAGSQILVKCFVVEEDEALSCWRKLKAEKKLPVEEMKFDAPPKSGDETLYCLRFDSVFSAETIAVALYVDYMNTENKSDEMFKSVSRQTKIHTSRIRIFDNDMNESVFKNEASSSDSKQ